MAISIWPIFAPSIDTFFRTFTIGRASFAPWRSPRTATSSSFAEAAGPILGDVNHVHPFREGNGRVQLQYLEQLAAQAGHAIALERVDPGLWLTASRASHGGDYRPMVTEIMRTLADRS